MSQLEGTGLAPMAQLEGSHIAHFFGRDVCIKETIIPKGAQIVQHRHHYPHLAYLVSGTVELINGAERRCISGPYCLEIPAGVHHGVRALTGAIWLCIHGTDETDPERVDEITVAPIDRDEVKSLVVAMNEGS